MAFDWTKVEGYKEDMTADEKLALLDSYEAPTVTEDPDKPTVSKAMYDKLASDYAKAKKDLRARQTASEQEESERAEREEATRLELEQLRKEKKLSSYKASYLTQGYDEQLAEEAAAAMVDEDTDALFAIMSKHRANAEKALRAKILKETPVPPAGDEPTEEQKKKKQQEEMRKYFGLR